MTKKYSQEELNEILLSKKLNEFYLAIIQYKQELLTDNEYKRILEHETIDDKIKDKVEDIVKELEADEDAKDFADYFGRFLYSLAELRRFAVLTMIDDDFYDIIGAQFEDLKRTKIFRFDNLTTLYDESNARIRYVTPEENPQITQGTVFIDVDDESIFQTYYNKYIQQAESEDLTSDFFNEIKGIPRTKNRQQG